MKTFKDYVAEAGTAIVPPSGQSLGPTSKPMPGAKATAAPTNVKAIWPGQGAPVEVGMTVGVKGPNGLPAPGQVSKVDLAAKGVMVKNPTTGQDEWMNTDNLEPFMAQDDQQDQAVQPGNQQTAETNQLARLRELAGIRENCSAGATGAGSIAVAPAAMGAVKKRQPTEEEVKREYTPKGPAKTIVGDTKPHQATGEMSANLAVRGKKTATRSNNGRKR